MRTVILLTLSLATGCSSANFDIPAQGNNFPTDDTGADSNDSGATEASTEAQADSGTVDTGAAVDSGSVDSGSVDSAPADTGVAETSPADTAPPVVCTPGEGRCGADGMTPQQCSNDGTAWTVMGGPCNYGCYVEQNLLECNCAAPQGRFQKVTDKVPSTGYSVKDTKTGLYWTSSPMTGMPWDVKGQSLLLDASINPETLCQVNSTQGWRVPTRAELNTILAYTYTAGPGLTMNCSSTVDLMFNFPHDEYVLTSEKNPSNGGQYGLNPQTGRFDTGESRGYVYCVRN